MRKTIKELYGWDFIKNPETSLLKHVNSVLNKEPDELDVSDICMLIRQELFLDIVIPKAVELIKTNHSVGDYYDYCLLVNLSKIESSLSEYKDIILDLILVLENDYKSIKFELESDEQDYLASIERLKEKLNSKD